MKTKIRASIPPAWRLLFLLLPGLCLTPAAAQEDGDFFSYSLDAGDNSIAITGYTGPAGAAAIPDSVAGLPVRTIAANAFRDNTALTSVTIPDAVTFIGEEAFFGCKGLTGVNIPASVTVIAGGAFSRCTGLTGVTIPDGVSILGIYAFEGCTGLTSVSIGNGITFISEDTFTGCTSLTGLTIGSAVTSIGPSAFENCTSLAAVTIPDSVTGIGEDAFERCTGLVSVTIGSRVDAIGIDAFNGCTSLTSATFTGNAPASVSLRAFNGTAPGLTIFHFEGSTGFTLPTWWGHPTVALPRLRVASLTHQGGTVSLTIAGGQAGWTYTLQRSPHPGLSPWTTVRTLAPLPATGPFELTDPAPPPARAFYRVSGSAN